MKKLIIKSSRLLSGKISISGSKNATLPILAASILARKVKIKNIPLVQDIFTMIELLNFIGLKTKLIKKKNIIEIQNTEKKINTLAPYKLVKTMRAGVLVLGSLLTKYRKAKVSLPGGCAIGSRPVDLHLFALKKLGAKIKIKDGYIFAEAKHGLKGAKINFPSISVGATENALLAAFKAEGQTVLKNCAIEPEIKDLITFLKKLGAKINIKGRTISIESNKIKSSKVIHEVIFDRIESGTYMIACALLAHKGLIIDKINPKIINLIEEVSSDKISEFSSENVKEIISLVLKRNKIFSNKNLDIEFLENYLLLNENFLEQENSDQLLENLKNISRLVQPESVELFKKLNNLFELELKNIKSIYELLNIFWHHLHFFLT
jgi:UDP-N-acetylglucosamine 1-carboxyvinyltransferase